MVREPDAGGEQLARRPDLRRTPRPSERTRSAAGDVSELGESAEREFSRRLWGKELTNSEMGQIWRDPDDPHAFRTHPATKL